VIQGRSVDQRSGFRVLRPAPGRSRRETHVGVSAAWRLREFSHESVDAVVDQPMRMTVLPSWE
jgi:hypothetical protein